jgi:quinol-cytochrome oxidoreductase complex cytochrome b subunit
MVLLIAFLHAVPVLLTAAITRKVKAVWISGAAMACIGLATGATKFAGADLIAVGVGVWIALAMCEKSSGEQPK